MEWVETTGRTIEAARELALDQLGVDAADAEFETLEEPKSGLFGRTRGVARVRARVSPKAPRPKAERRRRAPKRVDSGKGGESGQRSGPAPKRRDSGRGDASADDQQGGAREDAGSRATTGAGDEVPRGTSTSRRGRGAKDQSNRDDERGGAREQMDIDEQTDVLESFTSELATAMGLTASASSNVEDNQLTVNLTGEGLGHLVGPRMVTLDAVQEIARNALQRQAAGREYAKVVIDVEGIRARRRESLDKFVRDAATQVRDEQVEVVFDVMSSPDRKQVHDLVTELEGVESASEGEDPRRRVVLRPAD